MRRIGVMRAALVVEGYYRSKSPGPTMSFRAAGRKLAPLTISAGGALFRCTVVSKVTAVGKVAYPEKALWAQIQKSTILRGV